MSTFTLNPTNKLKGTVTHATHTREAATITNDHQYKLPSMHGICYNLKNKYT